MMMKWNKNEIRRFLDKLVNYWRYPFDYEIRICTGNFIFLFCDQILYFSDICNDHYDDSLVRIQLIYTYLVYSRNHVVMRMTQCQGGAGLHQALASLGELTCGELGIEYISQELLCQKESEFIDSFDFQSTLATGDALYGKRGLSHYVVTSVNNNITAKNDMGDVIQLEWADIEKYYIIKHSK